MSIDSIVKTKDGIQNLLEELENAEEEEAEANKNKAKKKKGKQEKDGIKNIICKMVPYITPNLAEH